MQLLTFVFTSNLTPGRTVSVKASCMKHALWDAAKRLGVQVCNLELIRVMAVSPRSA